MAYFDCKHKYVFKNGHKYKVLSSKVLQYVIFSF